MAEPDEGGSSSSAKVGTLNPPRSGEGHSAAGEGHSAASTRSRAEPVDFEPASKQRRVPSKGRRVPGSPRNSPRTMDGDAGDLPVHLGEGGEPLPIGGKTGGGGSSKKTAGEVITATSAKKPTSFSTIGKSLVKVYNNAYCYDYGRW